MENIKLYNRIIVAIVGTAIGVSIIIQSYYIPIIFISFGMLSLYYVKTKSSEIQEDEMIYRISEKASRKAFQIFGIFGAIVGGILLTTGEVNSTSNTIGMTLSLSVFFLLSIYSAFYKYYNKVGID